MEARHVRWAALVGVLVASTALAAQPTLKVSDRAPELQTGRWVQGNKAD